MTTYRAPVGEYQFLASHVLAEEFTSISGERYSSEILATILQRFGRFVEDRLVPLTASADSEGCRMTAEGVRAPSGYHEVYNDYIGDGWGALSTAIEDGGWGLPLPIGFACDELLGSGSLSFALYASIRLSVYSVIKDIGSNFLKENYLHKLGSGEWCGTMCLAERQCGTDLSLIRTTATEANNGVYRLSGTKIFVTGGDHDLTDNIIHLVLARIEGAAPGLAGLGLFVVPKLQQAEDGEWSATNGVSCIQVEDTLGIRASATTELLFENAIGWIVGHPGGGIPSMFSMMKLTRIGTSFQAIGVAEVATQKTIAYALDRVQGRDLTGGKKGPLPIAEHPNVRREIVRMRTLTASARMLAVTAALVNDQTQVEGDVETFMRAQVMLPVLMSISKVINSEIGITVVTAAMQMHGGHGYIRDSGIDVLLRDVQFLPVYESTNDMLALDLVVRRLNDGCHMAVAAMLDWLHQQISDLPESGEHTRYVERVLDTLNQIDDAAKILNAQLRSSPFSALQCGHDFLWLIGHGVMATLWLRVLSTLNTINLPIEPIAKRAEAKFYFSYLLADTDLRISRLKQSGDIEHALETYPISNKK
jgi:acyl-CoA dehydrogenase